MPELPPTFVGEFALRRGFVYTLYAHASANASSQSLDWREDGVSVSFDASAPEPMYYGARAAGSISAGAYDTVLPWTLVERAFGDYAGNHSELPDITGGYSDFTFGGVTLVGSSGFAYASVTGVADPTRASARVTVGAEATGEFRADPRELQYGGSGVAGAYFLYNIYFPLEATGLSSMGVASSTASTFADAETVPVSLSFSVTSAPGVLEPGSVVIVTGTFVALIRRRFRAPRR